MKFKIHFWGTSFSNLEIKRNMLNLNVFFYQQLTVESYSWRNDRGISNKFRKKTKMSAIMSTLIIIN